jgi:hypothetical protein
VCGRCCNCCDCDDSVDKSLENAIITEDDREITKLILKHLKLDNNKLNDIVEEVISCSKDIDKIKKILEYTVDIDWDNPMCPNTLIKQKDNLCSYISYFHLMLNNPYFLKFFLILEGIKSLHKPDTYVLDAMCELVRWCVERPSFNKNNMGSVDKIMKAFYFKEKANGEYFYCTKNANKLKLNKYNYLKSYYYGVPKENSKTYEEDLEPHKYGGYQNMTLPLYVVVCLLLDLQLEYKNIRAYFTVNVTSEDETIPVHLRHTIPNIFETAQVPYKHFHDTANPVDKNLRKFKLLGLSVQQCQWHTFALVYNNGIWYNKNTLRLNDCGTKTIQEIEQLCNDITNTTGNLNQQEDHGFQYIGMLNAQHDT